MTRLAITSMYANPIHPGHIECLDLSLEHADELWVIVNNDRQAEMKRWVKSFQDEDFRVAVVWALKSVSRVFLSIDQDGSVCESLKMVINEAKSSGKYSEIIFTKWGDRFASEIPEAVLLRSEFVLLMDLEQRRTIHLISWINSRIRLMRLNSKQKSKNSQKTSQKVTISK